MRTYEREYGEFPYRIQGRATLCGKDIHLSFTGGTREHIGAVSLAAYEPERNSATVSTISVYAHRDDVLAGSAAKRVSIRFRCTVTVTVGIHIDDAGREDIQILSENFEKCCERMIEGLEESIDETI